MKKYKISRKEYEEFNKKNNDIIAICMEYSNKRISFSEIHELIEYRDNYFYDLGVKRGKNEKEK